MRRSLLALVAALTIVTPVLSGQQPYAPAPVAAPATAAPSRLPNLDALKRDAAADVDGMSVMTQQMIDQIFSFGELGYQEFETSKYLTAMLRKNGFNVREGIAGMPTAWVATWGSGKPVIALGSDIDDIRRRRRSPAWRITTRSLPALPGTVRDTTPACRCRSPRRSR
jgi:aminobenzoyl-glutamate utilization protein B